LETGAL